MTRIFLVFMLIARYWIESSGSASMILETPQVGSEQTGKFGYKYHTSWLLLEPQSAKNQRSFSGSKLLINSPSRVYVLANFAVCLQPT